MTAFIVLCAVMALGAIGALAWPMLRPLPAIAKGEPVVPKAVSLAAALAFAVIVAGALLYTYVSTFPWNDPTAAQPQPADHGALDDAATMDALVKKLEAHLSEKPDDAEGWRMLGRTYVLMGRPALAIGAYERAEAVSKDKDPAIQLDLAEALVLADDPAQRARAQSILDGALSANPNNPKALWYRGVMAMRGGDHETAKQCWTRLLDQHPPAEIRDVIMEQLASIGGPVPGIAVQPGARVGTGGGPVAPRGRTIEVHVTLDPALANRLKPGVPLFVSARQPGIPGPPLAALRLEASQLPVNVTLSDANAMIEGRDLSSVDDVEVTARVAFSGSVMTSSGDLVGSAMAPAGHKDPLDIVITRVQP